MKKWLLVPMCLLTTFLQADLVPRMLIVEDDKVSTKTGVFSFTTADAGKVVEGIRQADNVGVFWQFPVYTWMGTRTASIVLRFPTDVNEAPACGTYGNGNVTFFDAQDNAQGIKMSCEWDATGVYVFTDNYLPRTYGQSSISMQDGDFTWKFLIFWEEE